MASDAAVVVDSVERASGGRWPAWLMRGPITGWVLAGAATAVALVLLCESLPSPESADGFLRDARLGRQLAYFFSVMIGLYVASLPIALRAAVRSVDRLGCVDEADREELRIQLIRLPRSGLIVAVAVGTAFHLGIGFAMGAFDTTLSGDALLTRSGFGLVFGWVHAVLFMTAVALMLRHGVLFLRLGRRLPHAPLLDHEPLAPFVHTALRLALLHAIWSACILAFHVDWSGDLAVAPQTFAMLPLIVVVVILLFLLPLWGVHERLAAERRSELARVHAAIAGDRAVLAGSPVVRDPEALGPIDLLVYREHVRGFSTWPFDASVLVRLGLYTAIPLLGWVGAALVERGLNAILG